MLVLTVTKSSTGTGIDNTAGNSMGRQDIIARKCIASTSSGWDVSIEYGKLIICGRPALSFCTADWFLLYQFAYPVGSSQHLSLVSYTATPMMLLQVTGFRGNKRSSEVNPDRYPRIGFGCCRTLTTAKILENCLSSVGNPYILPSLSEFR